MGETRYYTPFILRTGFLHSYERTLPVIVGWLILNIVIYWQMNVLDSIVGDPWTYLYLPLFVVVIHIAQKAVTGYDDLFGVLDSEFEKELKLYKSLDLPATDNQERIKDIFVENNNPYLKYKEKVRKLLFGGIERYFIIAIVLASPVITYLYFDAYLFVGVYGSTEPILWLYVYIISNLIIGFVIACSIASLTWIIFSMILSISKLEESNEGFKIANYIKHLKGDKFQSLDEVMGYDTFYEQTTAVGTFLTGLTLRALIIMVLYALNLTLFSFLNLLDLGAGVFTIGLFIIVLALILFVWPQLGLHSLLSRRKKEIMRELAIKKDSLDTEVMFITERIIDSEHGGHTLNEAVVRREASERVKSIYDNVKVRSTWGFEITTLIKYMGTSTIPFLTSLIDAISQGIFPTP